MAAAARAADQTRRVTSGAIVATTGNVRLSTRRIAGKLLPVAIVLITACGPSKRADILLFDGAGTSHGDVEALEKTLDRHRFEYATVDSAGLNAMSAPQLRAHRLLIVPGGNFVAMGQGIAPATAMKVHDAVENGLSYLGICAGAFLAGKSAFNGLNLTRGVAFPFYSEEARGARKAAVWVRAAGEPAYQHYWEDGPALIGWGAAIGRYPDGTPAIAEGNFGEGWVILSGVHPEAPESWRAGMKFATPADIDNDYAAKLIGAALRRTRLAHY